MPNVYKRIAVTTRGNWTEESLKAAILSVKNGEMTIYAASKNYGIPRKTLERRYKNENDKKGPMGPSSMLGEQNEQRLVSHIKTMQGKGFPLTIDDVRTIAFHFAERLNISHRFNKTTEKAGYDWMQMFLKRNPDITLRKSEGVSLARSQALNRVEVDIYFKLLEQVLTDNDLLCKPNCIFNMDESGLQLNNRPGHVLAKRGSKAVSSITSTEKGETITVIGCCNAEGTFLPPVCIFKGKNKKAEFSDGMPPGSQVFMSEKSAYITSTLFLEWLKTHFVPRKPPGNVLLLLDGHSTHCNSVEMLEYAVTNDVILLSIPSHTSHYLQPLDRSVFKSLKSHFYEQCRLWMKQYPSRRITRLSFGLLLKNAWVKVASAENAIAGFKATGVFPFNPSAIPDYAFLTSSIDITHNPTVSRSPIIISSPSKTSAGVDPILSSTDRERSTFEAIPSTSKMLSTVQIITCTNQLIETDDDGGIRVSDSFKENYPTCQGLTTPRNSNETSLRISNEGNLEKPDEEFTPSHILKEISPIPQKLLEARKRAKQVSILLTSQSHINVRKTKEQQKSAKEERLKIKKEKNEIKTDKIIVAKKRKAVRKISESSEDEEEPILCDSDIDTENEEDNCAGCGENYYTTQLIEDWLQCVICLLWVHENCTEFDNMCSKCGQRKKREEKKQKYTKRVK